jgi:hypothetical protein
MVAIAREHQQLIHVGDRLYRSSLTEAYYAIFQRDGRQVKRSLKTIDRGLAKGELEELRRKVERLGLTTLIGTCCTVAAATRRAVLQCRGRI